MTTRLRLSIALQAMYRSAPRAAFDQSGAFLFDFSAITDTNTGITTFQLGALDVASDGSLTQPTSPLTLATGGFWAVTDQK